MSASDSASVETNLSPQPVPSRPGWYLQPWTLDEAIGHDEKIAAFTKAKDGPGKVRYILAHSLVDANGVRLFEPADLANKRAGVFAPIVMDALRLQGLAPELEKND